MKHAFVIGLSLLSCWGLCPQVKAEDPASDQHVILISVDGLAHFYYDDPKAPMPTIRKLAADGARSQRMKTSLPTVTWTNHTTLVTGVQAGKHGVIANNIFDRATQKQLSYIPDPEFDEDQIVKVPTIYDLAFDAGLKTAGVIWPASRNSSKLTWTVPDVGTQELFEKYGTPSLLEECRAKGIPIEKQGEWCKAGNPGKAQRDYMYTAMAKHIITEHKPNLLMLHLVSVDAFEHATGSKSAEAYWAIKDSDNNIRELVEAVESAGLKNKTTFIITADHGFITYNKTIQPNVLLKQEGQIKTVLGSKVTERKVWSHSQGGVAFIYVLDQENRENLIRELTPKLAAMEGIQELITENDYAKYGLETSAKDSRMPDFILSAKDGYAFSDSAVGQNVVIPTDSLKGTHGYSPTNPLMDASFVASGAAVKKGVVLENISNTDVAPTIAKILNVPMKNIDGRALVEILK